jgi:hypothetical protein
MIERLTSRFHPICEDLAMNMERLSVTRRTFLGYGMVFLRPGSRTQEPGGSQTVELRAGELTLLLGNENDHGAGRLAYIGIWSLTSIHEPTNIFVPRYAG